MIVFSVIVVVILVIVDHRGSVMFLTHLEFALSVIAMFLVVFDERESILIYGSLMVVL